MARYANPKIQYFYANGSSYGEPLTDGYIYFYDSGTLNLKATYADSGLSIVNPNPMQLDGAGRINAPFLDGNYKVVLKDKNGVQQFEMDPVQGSLASGQYEDWNVSTTYSISDIVRGSDSFYYQSLTGSNLGNNPVSSNANWSQIAFIVQWNPAQTYIENDNVFELGTQYKSLQNGNINNPPSLSPAFWGVPTGGIVAGNPVSLLVNDVPYLEATGKAADSERLDSLNSTQFLRSDVSDSTSGQLSGITPVSPSNFATKGYTDGTRSASSNGYTILANGLYIMWGNFTATPQGAGVTTTHTPSFPVTLPNATLSVNATVSADTTSYQITGATVNTNSNLTVSVRWDVFGGAAKRINWIAIGY